MTVKVACGGISLGILVFRDNELLLIVRNLPPLGLAAPSEHINSLLNSATPEEQRYKIAAMVELKKQTGLTALSFEFVGERHQKHSCHRSDNSVYHHWHIYGTANVSGDLKLCPMETCGHRWCSRGSMAYLLSGKSLQVEGGEDAALEPACREWLQGINVLRMFSS